MFKAVRTADQATPTERTAPTPITTVTTARPGPSRNEVGLNIAGINALEKGNLLPQKQAVSGDDNGADTDHTSAGFRHSKRSRRTPKPPDHDVPSPTNTKKGRK